MTLTAGTDPCAVARAVRDGAASDDGQSIRIHARRPHPVHEQVGYIHPEMGLRVRTALARAARARGCSTRFDPEIRARRDRLTELAVEDVPMADEREALATVSGETERLRERVAEIRGELTARRDSDGTDADTAAKQFRDAARDLSEAETAVTAARQNLRRRRREARVARDRLERRLALEDDLANLERRARARLVDRVEAAYESAVPTVPGGPGAVTDAFEVDSVTAALAVARVAGFDAPVVLACDRFDSPRAASAWLGAPVVCVPA